MAVYTTGSVGTVGVLYDAEAPYSPRALPWCWRTTHGNPRSSAPTLVLGGSRPGSIHHKAGRDFFRMDAAAATDVAVFTTGNCPDHLWTASVSVDTKRLWG